MQTAEDIVAAPILAAVFIALYGWAILMARGFPPTAQIFPVGASVLGMARCMVVLFEDWRRFSLAGSKWREIDAGVLLPLLGLLIITPLIGLPAAVVIYVSGALIWSAGVPARVAVPVAFVSACAAFFLGQDTLGVIRPFDDAWLWILSLWR